MASKAEKRRNRKQANARAIRNSQNAGRPRQEGERYACGKLKPRKNERVIEAKRALVGDGLDIALADDPLDFILAKGWLSPARYTTAIRYRDARRRAGIGGPRLDGAAIEETASTSGVAGGRFADMTDEEITTVFDHVFRELPTKTVEEREAEALQKWKLMESAMTADQARQVGLIVIQQSWTFWITALNAGKEPEGRYARAREDFHAGLDAMASAIRKRRDGEADALSGDSIQSLPRPAPVKIEEDLNFVDEDGDPLEMRSERGRPFVVARKVRA